MISHRQRIIANTPGQAPHIPFKAGQTLDDGGIELTSSSCSHGNSFCHGRSYVVYAGMLTDTVRSYNAMNAEQYKCVCIPAVNVDGTHIPAVFGLPVGNHLTIDLRQNLAHLPIINAQQQPRHRTQVVQEFVQSTLQTLKVAFIGSHVIASILVPMATMTAGCRKGRIARSSPRHQIAAFTPNLRVVVPKGAGQADAHESRAWGFMPLLDSQYRRKLGLGEWLVFVQCACSCDRMRRRDNASARRAISHAGTTGNVLKFHCRLGAAFSYPVIERAENEKRRRSCRFSPGGGPILPGHQSFPSRSVTAERLRSEPETFVTEVQTHHRSMPHMSRAHRTTNNKWTTGECALISRQAEESLSDGLVSGDLQAARMKRLR